MQKKEHYIYNSDAYTAFEPPSLWEGKAQSCSKDELYKQLRQKYDEEHSRPDPFRRAPKINEVMVDLDVTD